MCEESTILSVLVVSLCKLVAKSFRSRYRLYKLSVKQFFNFIPTVLFHSPFANSLLCALSRLLLFLFFFYKCGYQYQYISSICESYTLIVIHWMWLFFNLYNFNYFVYCVQIAFFFVFFCPQLLGKRGMLVKAAVCPSMFLWFWFQSYSITSEILSWNFTHILSWRWCVTISKTTLDLLIVELSAFAKTLCGEVVSCFYDIFSFYILYGLVNTNIHKYAV